MHVLIPALHRPTKPTGVCRHAVNLAQCLAETDNVKQVTLVIGAWQRPYFETVFALTSDKIQVVSVEIKNSSLARNAWYLFGLPKLVSSFNPDLVHLSFPFPFWRSRFACPVVATIHDLYPYECPENFGFPQVLFNRLFLKQCVEQSDGLSCVSGITLERLKHYFPGIDTRKPASVAYNYVDFSHIQPKPPGSIKDINTPFLLSVAQHRKNKNLDLLIHAYATLLKQNQLRNPTKLILVGSAGPETDTLINQIQALNLQEQVLMLSALEDDELAWLYQNCELFAIPSSTEGFCLPLAEAMYLGCKVVCSDIPIFREIGSSDCTYFALDNNPVNNLEQAIVQAIAQPRPARTRSQSRFSRSSAAEQYLRFYAAILPDTAGLFSQPVPQRPVDSVVPSN